MFKESFKYYKSRKPPPSLKDVIDFDDTVKWEQVIKEINCSCEDTNTSHYGLKNPNTWRVYELINNPGLIYIVNPFTALGQRYWTVRCLRDFPFVPNKTNLKQEFHLQSHENLEHRLRWATLGYHHNWDTKKYTEDQRTEFPEDLACLSSFIAEKLGFDKFIAEAAIVNYYYLNSTLSGHTDNSEENLEAPLFSFSFGQSAIFLIGTNSLEDKPTPILVRSGDIIIMSKTSRLCYHGVPKILEDKTHSKWNPIDTNEFFNGQKGTLEICFDEESWSPYESFVNKCRINMNVRQVLKESQRCLSNG